MRRLRSPRPGITATVVFAVAASTAATVGWARALGRAERPTPSVRIVDVRPLWTSDPNLRDLITHTFAVRVAIIGWELLPYRPGATASENRPGAGHWRLYLDGQSLGDNFGNAHVSYTTYLAPGTHWVAAELSNADGTSLYPPIWSEPAILHVPRTIRCWQTASPRPSETGSPPISCEQRDLGRSRQTTAEIDSSERS